MFNIDPMQRIILTKNDTATIRLDINDSDGNKYAPQPGDSVYFTVRKTPDSTTYDIQKTLTSDGHFIINPIDTSTMVPGLYMYCIELTTSDGGHYTIVPPKFFQLESDMGV